MTLAPAAPYAADPRASRGREIDEPECPMRSQFQRDRDRVIHSTAFRRLTYKTQVFVYHEGDHYRTRLTHSLEVAQIARAMARMLSLDEDLAEGIALAHDLGHPPFGHTGERALERALHDAGGFDHNAQSLRVVTRLERKYAAFDGLNLSWELREGLVKHNGPVIAPKNPFLARYLDAHDLRATCFASAEAQVAALADDIAYSNHDIDDGLRAGLIKVDALRDVPLVLDVLEEVEKTHGTISEVRLIYEVNRRLITRMIEDVVGETRSRLSALEPSSADDVRGAERAMVSFSTPMQAHICELRTFLYATVYRHSDVMRVMSDAEEMVFALFERYRMEPALLPDDWQEAVSNADDDVRLECIADFVAGMTDRFAIREHRRLFDATPELR
ncbi:MAG: deoxyguanosinetriphosphate triphosphohydrolase [Hyphomicrobiaceae bacterium]